MVFDRIAERVPPRLERAISVGVVLLGLTGAILILAATAYGDWWVLGWAAVAFLKAGAWWQVADRLAASRRRH
jgi:hypothetical protein